MKVESGIEIERAFLVDLEEAHRQIEGSSGVPILQGYLAQQGDTEVRVRQKGNAYYLTVKKGTGSCRIEEEITLQGDDFIRLWKLTEGAQLEKTRYLIAADGYTVELDIYHGSLNGFCRAEVEFTSNEACASFTAPEWFGKEVTEDTRYANRSLARHGIPNA